jgi:hypothetical protein
VATGKALAISRRRELLSEGSRFFGTASAVKLSELKKQLIPLPVILKGGAEFGDNRLCVSVRIFVARLFSPC